MVEAFDRYQPVTMTKERYMERVVEGLENTNVFADLIDEDILLGSPVPLFTKTDLPEGYTNEKYLTILASLIPFNSH